MSAHPNVNTPACTLKGCLILLSIFITTSFWLPSPPPSTVISLFKQIAKELWTDLDDLDFDGFPDHHLDQGIVERIFFHIVR